MWIGRSVLFLMISLFEGVILQFVLDEVIYPLIIGLSTFLLDIFWSILGYFRFIEVFASSMIAIGV